jgi:alkylated DNA repair dioxygenase AlkB
VKSDQDIFLYPFRMPSVGALHWENFSRAWIDGHFKEYFFNSVLLNYYRDHNDSVGCHSDDEPELGPDPRVATVSLGAGRRFVVKPRRKEDGQRQDLELGHGALLVMGGSCQRHYVHGVPRQASVMGERISLTFRRLLLAPDADSDPREDLTPRL